MNASAVSPATTTAACDIPGITPGLTAYFDCFSGISGDMTLGALVDVGVPFEELRYAVATLPVQGYTMECRTLMRAGIKGTKVDVVLDADTKQPHRHFKHVKEIIDGSGFSDRVKARSTDAFHKLATAEAAVHATTLERVHFHEVGAIDAIVDVCGAMWALDRLGVERVECSPVAVGTGTARCAHGEMPVPVPAVVRILFGVPTVDGPVPGELTTPTGASILAATAVRFGGLDGFAATAVGYGAGTREYEKHTNYLRVLLGKSGSAGAATSSGAAGFAGSTSALPLERRELALLTTEIDDMSAELVGHVMELLFAAGALDVVAVPVHMKKNRPGVSLQALVDPAAVDAALEILMRETTTFGVKVVRCERHALPRRMETVATPYGPVAMKVGLWDGAPIKATPEYRSCRAAAAAAGVPVAKVFAAAIAAAGA